MLVLWRTKFKIYARMFAAVAKYSDDDGRGKMEHARVGHHVTHQQQPFGLARIPWRFRHLKHGRF